ncbi:MAG TPA: hypothetical protein DHV36_17340 [Desulfobacteraceae bacterium]|nr:hypothetical protein [Desulfobacteraceae bacterium]|tara:strand:+ start:608 stop:877 length:270 start_codon:yes stop_codon:yes gene_type:complete
MDLEKAKAEAANLRASAKDSASKLFNIPKGFSSGTVERMVDDIISAAILETAIIQAEASQSRRTCACKGDREFRLKNDKWVCKDCGFPE